MGSNPWRLMLDWWFPGQAMEWVTTFRWGLARIAGPYGHAILAGVLLVSGYRMQRWLEWNGGWEPVFAGMEWLPWRKARWLTVILLAGVLMSLVRGPWIGGLVAAVVAKVGRSRDKEAAIWATMALLLALVVPAVTVGWSYAAVGRVNALTVAQESAAYRKELVDKYIDIAIEHSLIGWGRNTWPRVGGLGSIDNHFLLLTLMHGVTALLLLVAILVRMIFRLFRQGMREPPQSGFSFTLLGFFWAIVVSLLTVYMGNQLVPFFFLMVGWAEGYLLTVRLGRVRTGGLRFREVLA